MTNQVATQNNTFSPLQILDHNTMGSLQTFSEFMAGGSSTLPQHLQNKPSDCMAICMQAMTWGMNPYAVAQQTSLVNGTLAYGAQLVNAVISSSKAIEGRFHYKYSDGWERLAGKVGYEQRNGKNYASKKWTAADENGLWIQVGAKLNGENEITWGEPVYLASVMTRNSPLWVTNPKQQIAYLALKYWSRLYTPDVILGVYTPDDLSEPETIPEEKVINPTTDDLNAALASEPATTAPKKKTKPKANKKQQKPTVSQQAAPDKQQNSEPVTIDQDPPASDQVQDQGDGEFLPSKYEIYIDSLSMVDTRAGYIEHAQMYRDLYEAGDLTPDEDNEIKKQLTDLHQRLTG